MSADIYSPCALGATINDQSIEMFKFEIIAGAANNQLKDEIKHAHMLKIKVFFTLLTSLLTLVDLINVYSELNGYDREKPLIKLEIYTLLH